MIPLQELLFIWQIEFVNEMPEKGQGKTCQLWISNRLGAKPYHGINQNPARHLRKIVRAFRPRGRGATARAADSGGSWKRARK